jgi:nucleoside-diphosphate-sugar epimerase
MKVLITGGAGFLGQRLAQAVLMRGALAGASGAQEAIDEVVLLDQTAAPATTDPRVRVVAADLTADGVIESVVDTGTRAIFHLAAVVSGGAEADFDLGMRVNLDATRRLLDRCRALGHQPRVVFASSVAVFGGELPDPVPATQALNPQSSYGTQKAIGELLVDDYSRRGFVDGRSVRLPTIVVRPGRPNAAMSSFASGIIREPLNGEPSVCPVSRATRLWLLSPAKAIECFIAVHDAPAQAFGTTRVVSLPGISVSVDEMVAALVRVGGEEAAARIRWEIDPRIERVAGGWPAALDTSKARALGLPGNEHFDEIIREYLATR